MAMTRDEVRGQIFSSKQFKVEALTLFGCNVEIRQPTVGQILEVQDIGDRKQALVRILVNYCYLPGTQTKVFEETDAEAILALPFGADLARVNEAIAKLTTIEVVSAEKNSEKTPGSGTSA